MTREEFAEHLRLGYPATDAVRKASGYDPVIVSIAEADDPDAYIRRGVMMAGPYMAALVALSLSPRVIPPIQMYRIKAGEPAGSVLSFRRIGTADIYDRVITSNAMLLRDGITLGFASEIFTSTLMEWLD